MLDRVVMDVVKVAFQVGLVADDVLPEPPLPNAAAAVVAAGVANRALPSAGGRPRQGKRPLDARPPRGEIRVALGKGPDRVQGVGQQDERVDPKRRDGPARVDRPVQQRPGEVVAEEPRPPIGYEREEERAARTKSTTVVGQGGKRIPMRCGQVER